MRKNNRLKYFVLLILPISLQYCSQIKSADSEKESPELTFYSIDDFKSVKKYDTHVHLYTMEESFIKQAEADNFQLININGDFGEFPSIEDQQKLAVDLMHAFPKQTAYTTTISVKNWGDKNWQKQTLAYLQSSFEKGAVGVKVWKNIGMELKDKNGKFVMINDPSFDPIMDFIAKNKMTLFSHQGEPKNCWLPVDEMTVDGDKDYFTKHPQYHMYLHPDYPSYEAQISARDLMIEKHPDLKIVSVHLASLEWSVDEIAKRLDKYPNMAVDMAARIPHLHIQAAKDWQKVHDFFIKYQDRILYGTDIITSPDENPTSVKENAHKTWLNDWKFFTSDEKMTIHNSKVEYKGLKLPREVIDKIYYKNVENWVPGILKNKL